MKKTKSEMALRLSCMPVLECQRFLPKLYHRGHGDLVEKLLLVMVVEVFDDSVPPRLGGWDEPEFDTIMQAETNKRSHASWMGWTSVKGQLIVHLKILWDSHTQPDRINSVQNALCCTGGHRLHPATVDRRIDNTEAVESDGASKVVGADQFNLMGLVTQKGREPGTFLPFLDISPSSPMGQFATVQDTANGGEGGKQLDSHINQFPSDGLIAAEEALVLQAQSNRLHDFLNLRRAAVGTGKRSPRLVLEPCWIIRGMTCHPFVRQGFVFPSEEQIASGLSPARYRCTADARCFRILFFMNTS